MGKAGSFLAGPVAALNPFDPQGELNRALGRGFSRDSGGGPTVGNIGPGQVTQFSEEFRRQREKDRSIGRTRGEELFGKVPDIQAEQEARNVDIADVLRNRRQIVDQGFGAPVFQAARESQLRNLQRQEQLAERNLRGAQGASGVGGPLASAQQAQLLADRDVNRRQSEQNLLLQEAGLKERGLGALEQSVASEQDRLRKLLLGIAGLEFGEASLGAQERGAAGNILTGQDQAIAAQQGANPGMFQSLFGGLFG